MTARPGADVGARLQPALGWLTGRRARSAGADRALLSAAALLFVVLFAFGLGAVPAGTVEITAWPFALLALVAVPAGNVANACEFAVAARMAGRRVPAAEALEVSVLGSAANMLPVPGAALVRMRAMRRGGTGYGRALSITAVVGGAWLATSLLAAGAFLAVHREPTVGGGSVAATIGAGSLGLAAVAVAIRSLAPASSASRLCGALLATEVLSVVVAAVRYLLVLRGLGLDVAVEQAVALTVATVLASALGFVPGGLGLREALAGVIAGMVGLPAATGVLAAAVDRLVGLPVLAALAAAFAARGARGARGVRGVRGHGGSVDPCG